MSNTNDQLIAELRDVLTGQKYSPVCTENLNPDVVATKSAEYRV
jgi:hypothetical protein